jgi:hypothetical protein
MSLQMRQNFQFTQLRKRITQLLELNFDANPLY